MTTTKAKPHCLKTFRRKRSVDMSPSYESCCLKARGECVKVIRPGKRARFRASATTFAHKTSCPRCGPSKPPTVSAVPLPAIKSETFELRTSSHEKTCMFTEYSKLHKNVIARPYRQPRNGPQRQKRHPDKRKGYRKGQHIRHNRSRLRALIVLLRIS